jgi:hypothetical protein
LIKFFSQLSLQSNTLAAGAFAAIATNNDFQGHVEERQVPQYTHHYQKPVVCTIPTEPPLSNPANNKINFFAVLNGQEALTTLMIRNIPMRFTQADILAMIEVNHANKFDYFYLPMDLKVRYASI